MSVGYSLLKKIFRWKFKIFENKNKNKKFLLNCIHASAIVVACLQWRNKYETVRRQAVIIIIIIYT